MPSTYNSFPAIGLKAGANRFQREGSNVLRGFVPLVPTLAVDKMMEIATQAQGLEG